MTLAPSATGLQFTEGTHGRYLAERGRYSAAERGHKVLDILEQPKAYPGGHAGVGELPLSVCFSLKYCRMRSVSRDIQVKWNAHGRDCDLLNCIIISSAPISGRFFGRC